MNKYFAVEYYDKQTGGAICSTTYVFAFTYEAAAFVFELQGIEFVDILKEDKLTY